MTVELITAATPEIHEAMGRLIPQLSRSAAPGATSAFRNSRKGPRTCRSSAPSSNQRPMGALYNSQTTACKKASGLRPPPPRP